MTSDDIPIEMLEPAAARSQPGYLTPIAVLVIGMLSIVLLLWTHLTSEQQANRHFVLDQAIAEVKVTVATSHLWLEEFLTEDPAVDIDARLAELEGSDDLMQLLIQGGEIDGDVFEPLREALLVEQAVAVRTKLTEFKNLSTKRRYLGGESAGIGSRLDQEYDEVFFKLLALADKLRDSLEVRWNRQQANSHMRLWVIIAAWFLVIGAAGAGLWTREQRRQKAEETLRERELELREAQKMEAVGRLAGGIAHDINNYLGAIRGYCEVAKMKDESGEALARRMDDAIETTQNISSLIKQLLAFSRRQPVAPEVVGLNHVVHRLESMVQRLIGDDIALVTHLDPEAWPIEIDPSQVEQILINLLVNARDALPKGGEISIETSNVVPDQADFEKHPAARPGRYTRLSVTDNGIGIAPRVREKIFEPFFTTKQDNSGLGLATVYGIVQQNRGFIVVESELGEGTRFKILLPSCAAESAEARVENLAENKTGTAAIAEGEDVVGARIFLVEDNNAMRASTREMLEALGHDVRVAASGEEALERLVDEDIDVDLVITDVIMPGLSGKELVDRLHEKRPNVRCLFISGYTDQVMVRHGLSEDRVDFLAKPFGASQLAGKIGEMLAELRNTKRRNHRTMGASTRRRSPCHRMAVMTETKAHEDSLYLRQLLAGRHVACDHPVATQMRNFMYLIGDPATRTAVVVDPAWNVADLVDVARGDDYEVVGALVTHYHPDHVGGNLFGQEVEGLAKLCEVSPVPIYVNKHEAEGLKKVTGVSDNDLKKVDDGDTMSLGQREVQFLHTPGHTPGSQCFLVDGQLVAGDTLFVQGCGRVDLPGGDPEAMYYTLTQKLAKLPKETVLFPGHHYGPSETSTIGDELEHNHYMRVPSIEDWRRFMG